jgi:hypothetical protein
MLRSTTIVCLIADARNDINMIVVHRRWAKGLRGSVPIRLRILHALFRVLRRPGIDRMEDAISPGVHCKAIRCCGGGFCSCWTTWPSGRRERTTWKSPHFFPVHNCILRRSFMGFRGSRTGLPRPRTIHPCHLTPTKQPTTRAEAPLKLSYPKVFWDGCLVIYTT